MARFDRYMLSQLLVLFGFFALVLVAIFWINQAVILFDRLIGDGQTALVFLEFTTLGLPRLITNVLPVAIFAAAVYVTNRLSNESELTVLQATGSGPWRLARPVLIYGLVAGLLMALLSHLLVPLSQAQLVQREVEISRNVTSRLLTEGTFLTPARGVTFYTRVIGDDGVLRDVFLSDRRSADERMIYTASESYLLRNGDETTLIMVDGLAQRLQSDDRRLSTAKFKDFSFDITALVRKDTDVAPQLRTTTTAALLFDPEGVAAATGASPGQISEALHARIAQPLFCVVTALVGFSVLLTGGFSRFGVWREIFVAFALLLLLDGLRTALIEPVRTRAELWPLIYLPTILGFAIAASALWIAAHPGWWARLRHRRSAA